MNGLLLFARYAFPPNSLGYCGPGDQAAFRGHLVEARADRGLRALAEQFEGAYPYLRLIALANGIPDPFDERVVEAYWIGNPLLERVKEQRFHESLQERFASRMSAREFSWMTAGLLDGARPHHNFHVFDVYRRAGLMRDDRAAIAVERMDECRISWATVRSVEGAELVVDRPPLVLVGGKLALGPAATVRVRRAVEGRGADCRPGDVVSLHWGWVCDRLHAAAQRALARATRRAIAHANLTM